MSEIITDELRWCLLHYPPANYADFSAIADRIDAEHKEACRDEYNKGHNDGFDSGFASADDWLTQNEDAMAEHGWVRLPRDANDEYVHIGDVMAYEDNTKPMAVTALVPPAVFLTEDGPRYADMCRHYHAPTVNELLDQLEGLRGNGADYEDVVTRASEIAKTLRGLLAVRTNERSS